MDERRGEGGDRGGTEGEEGDRRRVARPPVPFLASSAAAALFSSAPDRR